MALATLLFALHMAIIYVFGALPLIHCLNLPSSYRVVYSFAVFQIVRHIHWHCRHDCAGSKEMRISPQTVLRL